MADVKPKQIVGCLASAAGLMVTIPIWYVLLFGILSRVEAPNWMWALYWVYLPAGIFIQLAGAVVKLLDE